MRNLYLWDKKFIKVEVFFFADVALVTIPASTRLDDKGATPPPTPSDNTFDMNI